MYFPSGSHWCSLRWRVGKSLESRCLSYKVRLPPVELEIPGVEIEKKRSRCCNEDPQIQVLLSPKEGRQNLWPVQNEKDIRSLHGVRVVEELSILNSFTGPTREASRSSNLTSFFPTARDPVQERTRQPCVRAPPNPKWLCEKIIGRVGLNFQLRFRHPLPLREPALPSSQHHAPG